MSLSKFAYLAGVRCRSMPENVFNILKTVYLVKTQKQHCQNLRFLNVQKWYLSKFAHLFRFHNKVYSIKMNQQTTDQN